MSRRIGHPRLALFLALAAFSAVGSSRALDPSKALTQYSHDNWQSDRGLPQNAVKAIVQGPEGYLWCATQEGLARFDGVQFTVFDKWNTPAIRNNNVRALCLDRSGALWIGTNGGLLRMKDGVFRAYTTREGLVYDNVTSICETKDGSIWAGTYGGGLSRLKDGRFTNYTVKEGLTHNSILVLFEDKSGTLWIGTNGGGICRFEGGRFSQLDQSALLPNPVVYAICQSRDGALWVGTYGGGLCRVLRGRMEVFTTRDGLSNDRVLGLYEDKDANLWIATFGGGICRYAQGRWDALTTSKGLPYNVVWCFFEDREGNLWVGLDGGGLLRMSDGSFTTFSSQEGLSNDFAIGIYEARSGDLWVTTNGGGINLMRGGRFTSCTTKEGLPNDLIRSICEDSSGGLWVGTDGGGAARIAGGRVSVFNTAKGLSSNRVIAVKSDRAGNLWAGTNGGGLNRIRDGAVKILHERSGPAGMVNLVFEDREGRLWIGNYGGGLSILAGDQFTGFPGQEAIGMAIISHMLEDPDGTLWLSTIGSGLLRLRGGLLTRFTKRDGLFDDVAYEVLDDGLGYLWMSGNRGVYRVARRDLESFARGLAGSLRCDSFGEADGMKSAECNGGFVPSGQRTRDGRLWFPTMRGVSVVDPSKLLFNKLAPPVLVERVVVNGAALDADEPVVLPPGRNRVEIHYTGLSFVAPSKVKFRYLLDGFESTWVDADIRRVAYYTNIPPGRYRFRVTACNNDGVWNESGASIALFQRPSFYQTWWFYGLSTIILLLAGSGIYLARVRQLSTRQRQLEALVAERTQELQGANRQLERANSRLETLSAEDPLTGLANRRRFDEQLLRQWGQLGRSRKPLSLVMVDLDFFKLYNDTLGHPQGDECLASVASVLAASVSRAGDLSARYGGEEFALILSDTDAEGALTLAEHVRATIQALEIPHSRSLASSVVTVSAGVATAIPGESSCPKDLLDLADKALYQAKHTGRNRVCAAS